MVVRPIRVYLDTSIIGGYLDPEFREASRSLWRQFEDGRLIPVLGEQTLIELAGAPLEVQGLLDGLPADRKPDVLAITMEATALAQAYLDGGALPAGSRGDALHVAIAVVHGIGVLLSWNFRHMANVRRNRAFNAVNINLGYGTIEIRSPLEVVDDRTAD